MNKKKLISGSEVPYLFLFCRDAHESLKNRSQRRSWWTRRGRRRGRRRRRRRRRRRNISLFSCFVVGIGETCLWARSDEWGTDWFTCQLLSSGPVKPFSFNLHPPSKSALNPRGNDPAWHQSADVTVLPFLLDPPPLWMCRGCCYCQIQRWRRSEQDRLWITELLVGSQDRHGRAEWCHISWRWRVFVLVRMGTIFM